MNNKHNIKKELIAVFISFAFSPKRIIFSLISLIVFSSLLLVSTNQKVSAADGIRKTINFQGKLVNSNGTNVADGDYDIVFAIYTQSSGGAAVWTESRTGGNQVTVNHGIFQVELGSVTSLPGSINFNTDSLYLGITVEADSEMTPRVRFTSVPQAFNAEKVNGLTVTNTSDNPFSSTTTLKIGDGKTVVINNGLTFSGTDSTTFTFPTSSGNLVTEDFTQTLTNKSIGNTGLTFSGATTDVTTGTNENFVLTPNGSGLIGFNTTSPLGSFNARPNGLVGGTIAIASISGATSFASLLVDNLGSGDIIAASTGGVPKFVVKNNGQLFSSNYANNGGILYTATSGIIQQTAGGSEGLCLTFTGGLPAWGPCLLGTDSTKWVLSTTNGTLSPINNTLDLLWGGTSSSSSQFRITGSSAFKGTQSAASVSANTSFAGFVIDNKGVGDLFTASSSGVQQLVLTNNGALGLGLPSGSRPSAKLDVNGVASISSAISFRSGTGTIQTTSKETLIIGGASTGFVNIDSGSGNIYLNDNTTISGALGGLTGLTLTSGAITLGGLTGTGQCLLGGVNASWGACDNLGNFWQYVPTSGIIAPGNLTSDVLFGGVSSSSATFRVTGDSNFRGTQSAASVSANTSFAGLVVDNRGVGDLFTASSAGMTRFKITQNGDIAGGINSSPWSITSTGSAKMKAWEGGGLDTACNSQLSKIVWNSDNKQFECATDVLGEATTPDTATFIDTSAVAWQDNNTTELFNDSPRPNITTDSNTAPVLVAVQIRGDVSNTTADAFLAARVVYTTDGSAPSCTTSTQAGQAMVGGFTTNTTHPWQVVGTFIHVPGVAGQINYTVCTSALSVGTATDTPEAVEISLTELGNSNSNWTLANGAFRQNITSADVLIGGTATSSSKIAFIGMNGSTTPVASISAIGGANDGNGIVISADGSIVSLRNNTLSIGGGTTGELIIGRSSQRITLPGFDCSALGNGGKLTTTAGGVLACDADSGGGGSSSNFWQYDTTTGVIAPGNLTVDVLFGGVSSASAGFRITGNNNLRGTQPAASVSANTSFSAFVIDNRGLGDLFTASSSGVTQFVLTNNGALGLGLNGSLPTAKLDVNGSASISSSLNFRSGSALVTATANNTLTLGGGETGNVLINPLGGAYFGIGTSTPLASIDLRYSSGIGQFGGTLAVASVSGRTTFSALTVDNLSTIGDIFTASSSSNTQFVIRNNGAVGIGNLARIPSAMLDVAGLASVSSQLSFRSGVGALQTTSRETLTIGGTSTGFINLDSASGKINILDNTSITGTLDGLTGLTLASGAITLGGTTGTGQCLVGGASASWGSCGSTGAAGTWTLDSTFGTHYAINTTLDTLFGGTSTATAGFRITGSNAFRGTQSAASVSANTSFAGLVIDNRGVGDLFTASSSGVTQLVLTNNGALGLGLNGSLPTAKLDVNGVASISSLLSFRAGSGAIQTTGKNTLTIGGNSTGDIQFLPGNSSTSLYLASSGAVGFNNTYGISGQCLISAGAGTSPSWGGCTSGSNGNWWTLQSAQGTLYPINTTLDFLWGGTTTSSASFKITGDNRLKGTQVAASVSANTSYAGMVVDNAGVGDLFTASKAGATRFVIGNTGNVGIGVNLPQEKLHVNGNVLIDAKTNSTALEQQTWTQVSGTAGTISGLDSPIASISAMTTYNGSLYVGTYGSLSGTAAVYRYSGTGTTWERVSQSSPGQIASGGTSAIASVSAMTVFNGHLYVGTSKLNSAEVYRYDGGTTWARVNSAAGTLGAATNQDGISALGVFNGRLYAGTREGSPGGTAGARLARYEGTTWTVVNTTGGTFATSPSSINVYAVTQILGFNGALYIGTYKPGDADVLKWTGTIGAAPFTALTLATGVGSFTINGTAVTAFDEVTSMVSYNGNLIVGLRKNNGAEVLASNPAVGETGINNFTRLNNAAGQMVNGGTSAIDAVTSMVVYNGMLYVGTYKQNSAEIYRYTNDYEKFLKVSQTTAGTIASGGKANIDAVTKMVQLNGDLYAGTQELGGAEVYKYEADVDSSYALKFHAQPQIAGGEQNSQQNIASIFYLASASANLSSNAGNTGAFIFSHGIQTRNGSYDVAEDYATRDETLQPGDIVSIDTDEAEFVTKSKGVGDTTIIGVYSEKPALRLSQLDTNISGGKAVPVALAGRVPVKVSTENGPIKPGDYITSSSVPGVGMKATKAGSVIGQAMGSFDGEGVGRVIVYVKSNSYGGSNAELLTSIGNGTLNANDNSGTFLNANGEFAGKISINNKGLTYSTASTGNAEYYRKSDANEEINVGDLVCLTNSGVTICNDEKKSILGVVSNEAGFVGNASAQNDPNFVLVVTTGQARVKIANETDSIKKSDFVSASASPGSVQKANSASFVLGRALEDYDPDGDRTILVTISPTWYDPALFISSTGNFNVFEENPGSGRFSIKDAEGQLLKNVAAYSEVAAANLKAGLINAQKITLNGRDLNSLLSDSEATTTAKLKEQNTKLSEMLSSMNAQNDQLASLSARLGKLEGSKTFNLLNFASSSANFVTVADDLLVLGNSTFNNATVADTLSIGNTMQITGSSIDTVGETLSIQPLRQGTIDIMGGAITIDTDGNAIFTKNLKVEGILEANIIKGIDEVLTVSGSAQFEKASFKKLEVATDDDANKAAGVAVLGAGDTTIVIPNKNVTSKSLIFLTPTSGVAGQSLYIKSKVSGQSFTVGLPNAILSDIEFNYLIIN